MSATLDRRAFIHTLTALGFGGTLFPGILWAKIAEAATDPVTPEMVAEAERLAGLEFTEEEREFIAKGLRSQVENFKRLRNVPLDNSVPPAIQFNPILPGMTFDTQDRPFRLSDESIPEVPADLEQVAFWTVTELSRAIRARKIRSLDLTKMYLARLKKYDPVLHCVITLTEKRALRQAKAMDKELAKGNYRGPLHGIPWGAKDLLAVKGYPTTWGAMPYKDQVIDTDATVVEKLDAAGAVLLAKLALGALAQGDVWYGGRTRNPWNTERGSSGSSAGPGSATAAGLVGFAIGSETNGSITSPATVNGVTGLRPTYGRVSRRGAMALSWSMDKLGPMCRSVEDCAIVLDAIAGPDGQDLTVTDLPFNWDADLDIGALKIGYVKSAFKDGDRKGNNERSLDELRDLGVDPRPIELPDLPFNAMAFILNVEAAAAFDDLTRSNRDDELVSQGGNAWPNTFRRARFVPAVEYINANRVRTLLMRQMQKVMEPIDAYITPTMNSLYLGNFTGHPIVSLPNGFSDSGTPTSIGFVGRLYGEGPLLALAKAFQDETGYHKHYPPLET